MLDTPATRAIDALRLTAQDLDICIDSMRKKMRRGWKINRKTYPDLIRRAYDLREAAEAYGFHGPLVELVEPMPYRTGFIGRTREEVKAIEWIGAGDLWGGRTVERHQVYRQFPDFTVPAAQEQAA